ncbi:uncharacterized protein V1516DRAFT_678232 [Lipomyces oligophaga]|uniref:uncharacterized protein n=1 Tax=Lipomyces oligophaga TaxID=45792 RepID=UPI0034CEBE70
MNAALFRAAAARPAANSAFRNMYANQIRAASVRNFHSSFIVRADKSIAQPTSKLAKLKDMPAELYPLAIVLLAALGFAAYGIGLKLLYDPGVKVNRSSK